MALLCFGAFLSCHQRDTCGFSGAKRPGEPRASTSARPPALPKGSPVPFLSLSFISTTSQLSHTCQHCSQTEALQAAGELSR